MPELPEAPLVACSRQGDREAFGELVRTHSAAVYSYLRRRVAGAEEAADLTQECFLRAWQGVHSFRGECAFRTWLYRIAWRLLADRHARKRKQPQTETMPEWEPPDPTESGPGEQVERKSEQTDLTRAVKALPPLDQELLRLLYADGFSYEQISELLAMPLGTVKTRLHRVRQRLKDHLEKLWEVRRDA